ncbi:unnamed protein product, partial [Clonostachys rosea f. rosea IK726]
WGKKETNLHRPPCLRKPRKPPARDFGTASRSLNLCPPSSLRSARRWCRQRPLRGHAAGAPRILINEFTLSIRSGMAWEAPAGSIVNISTPEGAASWFVALQGNMRRDQAERKPHKSFQNSLKTLGHKAISNIWNRHNPRERFWASRTPHT